MEAQRNGAKPYIKEYWKHVPISEPEEDADSRIVMYMIRNQVQLASLYPNEDKLRDMYLSNMQLLVNRVMEELASSAAANVPGIQQNDKMR